MYICIYIKCMHIQLACMRFIAIADCSHCLYIYILVYAYTYVCGCVHVYPLVLNHFGFLLKHNFSSIVQFSPFPRYLDYLASATFSNAPQSDRYVAQLGSYTQSYLQLLIYVYKYVFLHREATA